METFFSFPNPINNAESRLHGCLATLYVPMASILAWQGVPWLWVWITFGYTARVLCGPRLDPQVCLAAYVLLLLISHLAPRQPRCMYRFRNTLVLILDMDSALTSSLIHSLVFAFVHVNVV